jgi:hypothetical protein
MVINFFSLLKTAQAHVLQQGEENLSLERKKAIFNSNLKFISERE